MEPNAQLKQFIEQIERQNEEKAEINENIKDIFAVAKSSGFDTKAMREVIRLRKKSAQERRELEEATDMYKHALGME